MNDLHRLFPRPVAPPAIEPDGSDGGAGGAQTHWERLMWDARDNFNDGNWQKGLASVTQAAYVGVVKRDEEVSPDVALALVRAVLGVSWHPEDAA